MNGTKSIFLSKTVWGGVAAVVGGGVSVGGYFVTGADIMQVHELLTGMVGILGGLGAIYGRIKADRRIG